MKITVTPAEEDEVIVAGAEAQVAFEPETEQEPEREPERENESAREAAEGLAKVEKRPEAYRETTLEDLESSKMSSMQRVIIIAAIVCIIAALVYYFVAMR